MNSMTFFRTWVGDRLTSALSTVLRLLMLVLCFALTSCSLCHSPNAHVEIECITPSDSLSYNPWIACDANGHVVLAWTRNIGGREDVWYVEKDSGGDWSQPANLSQSGGQWGSRRVSLCYDRSGTLHAAWSQAVDIAWVILYTRREMNGTWAVPETIVHGIAVIPSVGADSSGSVHLLFEDIGYGFNACYARRDPTAGWGPVSVLRDNYRCRHAALAVRPDGRCIVVYAEKDSAHVDGRTYWLSCRNDTWTSRTLLDSTSWSPFSFAMSADGSTAYLAYRGGRGGLNDLWVWAHRDESGWKGPDTLCPQSRFAHLVTMAATSDSSLVVGWVGSSSKVMLASRNSVWSNPIVVAGADSTNPCWRMSLAIAPDGLVHLTWAGGSADHAKIYYTSVRME